MNNKVMFSVLAVAVMIVAVGFMIVDSADYSDASVSGGGTQSNPYTYIDITADQCGTYFSGTKYVKVGSSVAIRDYYNSGNGWAYQIIEGGGHGLTISSGSLTGTVTGNAGDTVSFQLNYFNEDTEEDNYQWYSFTLANNTYTVTWKNWDNTTLETDYNVTSGTTPTYNSATPTRPATAQYTYTFTGWSPAVGPISGNTTYTAQFSSTVNNYTVTWKNWDNTTLETDANVPYGSTPTYNGATPTRPATAQYTYTFTGWSPSVSAVTGNTTYTAQFSSTVNNYTVTWKNWDNTTLETDANVPYGSTPTYDGATPSRSATFEHVYTFTGWSPAVGPITGNTTYTAQFSYTTVTGTGSAPNPYTTIDITANLTDTYFNGTKYVKVGASVSIARIDSGNWSYQLIDVTAGHGLAIQSGNSLSGTVTGNAGDTVTFRLNWFNETTEEDYYQNYTFIIVDNTTYTVTWKNWDNTTLETDTGVYYGVTPTYDGATPTRPATAQYTYTFTGWSPAVGPITGNTTYTAQFSSTVNNYTVTWKNWDNTTLETDANVPYGSTPTYDGATPSRSATFEHVYTFTGWSPAVGPISGNTTYTAQFSYTTVTGTGSAPNPYTTIDITANLTDTYFSGTKYVKVGASVSIASFDSGNWSYQLIDVTGGHGLAIQSGNSLSGTVTGNAGETVTFRLNWFNETTEEDYYQNYTFIISDLFNVTWVNWDGSTLETDTGVYYGVTPTYDGATPVKPSDIDHSYTFTGWSPAVGPITGNTTYTAQFSTGPVYVITWVNWDGSTLETDITDPGVTPTYDGATPSRSATVQATYTFTGWLPNIGPAYEDRTYTAQYSATAIIYNLDDWTYTVNDDFNAQIIGYSGEASNLMIPSKFDIYAPVSIGAGVFQDNTAVKVLVIPTTVNAIGDNAFSGSGITDVINFSGVALNSDSYGLDNAVIHTSVPGWLYMSNADYTVTVEKTDTASVIIRLLPIVIVIGLVLYFVYRLRDREEKLY